MGVFGRKKMEKKKLGTGYQEVCPRGACMVHAHGHVDWCTHAIHQVHTWAPRIHIVKLNPPTSAHISMRRSCTCHPPSARTWWLVHTCHPPSARTWWLVHTCHPPSAHTSTPRACGWCAPSLRHEHWEISMASHMSTTRCASTLLFLMPTTKCMHMVNNML